MGRGATVFKSAGLSVYLFWQFDIGDQGQRLGAVFFGKLCGTAPAQKGKVR